MSVRSKFHGLPEELQEEVNKRLVDSGFSGYTALSDWLQEQGYEWSKSGIGRYALSFHDKVRAMRMATQQAQAIVEAVDDTDGDMNTALIQLVQQQLFTYLVDMQSGDPDIVAKVLPKMAKAIADISRASVSLNRYRNEVRERTKAAAEDIEKEGKKRGLSPEMISDFTSKILGIAK